LLTLNRRYLACFHSSGLTAEAVFLPVWAAQQSPLSILLKMYYKRTAFTWHMIPFTAHEGPAL
jgi:hypothetical protein